MYSATSGLMRYENKNIFFCCEKHSSLNLQRCKFRIRRIGTFKLTVIIKLNLLGKLKFSFQYFLPIQSTNESFQRRHEFSYRINLSSWRWVTFVLRREHRNLKTRRKIHWCIQDDQIGRKFMGLAPADMARLPHLINTKMVFVLNLN
jgi:hypothetical protein